MITKLSSYLKGNYSVIRHFCMMTQFSWKDMHGVSKSFVQLVFSSIPSWKTFHKHGFFLVVSHLSHSRIATQLLTSWGPLPVGSIRRSEVEMATFWSAKNIKFLLDQNLFCSGVSSYVLNNRKTRKKNSFQWHINWTRRVKPVHTDLCYGLEHTNDARNWTNNYASTS